MHVQGGAFSRQPVRTQQRRAFFEAGPVRRPVRRRQRSRQIPQAEAAARFAFLPVVAADIDEFVRGRKLVEKARSGEAKLEHKG